MGYNITPRRLFEMGVISEERFWQLSTPEERDQVVLDNLAAGRLSTDDPEYADYYNHRERYRDRWDPLQFDEKTRERFPWLNDDLEDI